VTAATPSDERARLIATADMLVDVLKDLRSRQGPTADSAIVARWIARIAGVRENLDAITEWESAKMYPVNGLHPGDALRRLFPDGLADGDFEQELRRLETELARDDREREPEPPAPPMSPDDTLVDLLAGHGSGRFRYLDVRSIEAWRRERSRWAAHIPLERLTEDAPRAFRKETDLVVFGDDDASTQAAIRLLERAGFQRTLALPGGIEWFKRVGWHLDTGPG
jgi:rhodanese-related sulfurtransferase